MDCNRQVLRRVKERKGGMRKQKRLMHDRPTRGASVCKGKTRWHAGTEKYIYTVNSGAMERWVGMSRNGSTEDGQESKG